MYYSPPPYYTVVSIDSVQNSSRATVVDNRYIYPYILPFQFDGTYETLVTYPNDKTEKLTTYRQYSLSIAKTDDSFSMPDDWVNILASNTVYAFTANTIGDYTLTDKDHSTLKDPFYYALVNVSYPYSLSGTSPTQPCYYRIPSSNLNGIIPPSTNLDFSDNIHFLYSFGDFLTNTLTDISDLLGFSIGGSSFLLLIAGGGFLVYMAWVVIKFIIPS